MSFILILVSFTTISACTYSSTISGNHINIQVDSNDFENLGILEILNPGHEVVWGKMYQPTSVEWVTTWEELTNDVFFALIGGSNKETAYWGFNEITQRSTIPYGTYGVDYTGTLNHDIYYVQMNHPEDVGTNYIICQRSGEILPPTPPETLVTKTVFTPGLGASWSLKDFINCSKTSNQSDWSLAPYAKSVYTGILDALDNAGWTTLPFYYDWRQNISNNSQLLSNYIDNNTSLDEKVNFVGHSMGGLVGRGYMEASSESKLAKFYSVGTPHHGSALSYGPWEGGEVWTNNLIEKIGVDLYLKHCGGLISNNRATIQSIFPSVQNLLPTLPYLRDKSSGNLKDISSMKVKNNFITDSFATSSGIKIGTLSGNGQKTLEIIDVINPGRNESRNGNWIDGIPIGREYTDEGDGTVLKSSSEIAGASQNDVIPQTHRGLVASTEGINAILSFLGSPGIEDPEYSDDTSALVLVGYPGKFQITDEKGAVTPSEDGMIVIMNPKDSNYQIQFDPNNEKTTLVVDQFLTNGQTSYKEYKYSKAPTDVKILEFNSKRVNTNPVHEVKEYKKPRFPIFWHGFWKWWIKYRK